MLDFSDDLNATKALSKCLSFVAPPSVLEVKYLEEVGACLGPTSRFYALVSEEFEVSKIWRDSGHGTPGAEASPFVHHESGLYPVPRFYALVSEEFEVSKIWRDSGHGTPGAEASPFVHHESGLYPVPIGAEDMGGLRRRQFVAKALFDSRIIDLSFNKVRLKLVLGEEVSLTSATLKCPIIRPVCPQGYPRLRDHFGNQGVQRRICKVFPDGDRQAFAVEELMKLFGNGDEDCTVETLSEALEADHGFNPESRAVWDLLEIMAEYDASTRLPVTRRNNQISGRSFRRVFLQLVQCVHYEFGNCNVNDDECGPHK
ncbi:hypothetical protein HHX47_DHR5000168 [Lentinula edodes]|nr:hypothetical protein HHX47_DHR5000168 [Lentinula edodes]